MAAMLLGGPPVAGAAALTGTTAAKALHRPHFLPPRPHTASWRRLCLQTAPRSSPAYNAPDDRGDIGDKYKGAAEKVKEATGDAEEPVTGTAGEAKDRAQEKGGRMADQASSTADRAKNETKDMAEGAMDRAGEAKDRAAEGTRYTGEKVVEMTKEGASKVVEAAQALGEKAKQAAQDAWGAAKEAAKGVKDKVAAETKVDEHSTWDDVDAAMKERDRVAQEEQKRQAGEKGAGLP